MRILGIESSCDETAVSIIEVTGSSKKPSVGVLANIVSSQMKLHAKFGGVVPNLAKREHQRNFVPVLVEALRQAEIYKKVSSIKYQVLSKKKKNRSPLNTQYSILNTILDREPELFERMKKIIAMPPPNIDAIAVTVGPGLAPALWVGVNFAKALSYLWGKPIIPVNHLEGHIYANLLPDQNDKADEYDKNAQRLHRAKPRLPDGQGFSDFIDLIAFRFPALCLIVSGGHTELVIMKRFGKYKVIGETLDDAAGEAFDKVAKMLGLGFPGGPIVSKLAESGNPKRFQFPRPMIRANNFDFSFSGLKTSVLYKLRDLKKINAKTKRDIAASFETAVVEVLVAKTIRAAKKFRPKTVLIGGGVAANKKLRHDLSIAIKKLSPIPYTLFPHVALTGDNALMIALAGYFNRQKPQKWKSLAAFPNLRLDQTPH